MITDGKRMTPEERKAKGDCVRAYLHKLPPLPKYVGKDSEPIGDDEIDAFEFMLRDPSTFAKYVMRPDAMRKALAGVLMAMRSWQKLKAEHAELKKKVN